MQRTVLFTTGGTIEKSFDPRTGNINGFEDKVRTCIQGLRFPWLHIEITSIICKDSLDVTEHDRSLLLDAIRMQLAEPCPIIVTHGTDTAVETGRFLDENLPSLPVPIVLTGAMVPLGFDGSDGQQNLAQSLMAARLLPAGVFLVMHGEAYPIRCVEKLPKHATFGWTCSHELHQHFVNRCGGPVQPSPMRHQ